MTLDTWPRRNALHSPTDFLAFPSKNGSVVAALPRGFPVVSTGQLISNDVIEVFCVCTLVLLTQLPFVQAQPVADNYIATALSMLWHPTLTLASVIPAES